MRMQKSPTFVWAAVCVLALTGCGSPSSSHQPISVALTPTSAFVGSGQALQFTADVTGGTSGVTWSGSGAVGGAIDAQGNFTAPTVTQNATATVTTTSVKD